MPPSPKPTHNRRVPKNRKQFSIATIRAILIRDDYQCVRCGSYQLESVPHHVVYRSSGGEGTLRNGISVCRDCHSWFHASKKNNNKWAEEWVELNLDSEGYLRFTVPRTPTL